MKVESRQHYAVRSCELLHLLSDITRVLSDNISGFIRR